MAAPTEAWYFAHLIDPCNEIAGPGDLQYLHRTLPSRYPFLLQSSAAGGTLGRFDILFAFPGDSLELTRLGELRGRGARSGGSFLDTLDRWWSNEKAPSKNSDLPFLGGWFLYLGYELAAEIEPGLRLAYDPVLPVAFAVRCPTALIYDHKQAACYIVSETQSKNARQAVRNDLRAPRKLPELPAEILTSVTEEEAHRFTDAVMKAKNYIAAGHIYQANLSRQWSTEVSEFASGGDIYDALCKSNPAPFAGIAHWQGVDIISSSPERLLSVRDGIAETRPIAGTRPRSADDARDTTLSAELFSHPKEIAEHVML
ncbi:MAG: chorismate-binding protein, partial [Gammaproteobacteria bacterium]|nr:chorismate-binding protein [Gammaproteobacteria bacterium]